MEAYRSFSPDRGSVMALRTKLSLIAATVAVAALAVAVAPQTSAAPAAGHAPVHKINVLGE
jgi:hypothetical protein